MFDTLPFTHKVVFVTTILILITSSVGLSTAPAQVNAETNLSGLVGPSQGETVTANALPLGTNVIPDSSFETSYGSEQYWIQSSTNHGTPLCNTLDIVSCGGPYQAPRTGTVWIRFGGTTATEVGDIYQKVIFPKCGAKLEFYLWVGRADAGSGADDYMDFRIDGNTLFYVLATQASSYPSYKLVSIPVNQFADGEEHYIEFVSLTSGQIVNFNVDDVALIPTLPTSSGCAAIEVKFAGESQATYAIPKNDGDRQSYPVSAGPVVVDSTNSVPFVTAERVVYKVNNVATSFSELMGLPQNLVGTKYSFPAYDNLNFDSQLRFANLSGSMVTVRVYINGNEMTNGGLPSSSPYSLGPGESLRVKYWAPNGLGMNGGPLVVESSGGNIVASLRIVPNTYNGSYSEVMGLPQSQVSTTYLFPWYNNNTPPLDTQLRIGNPNLGGSSASVRLYIGDGEKTSGCTSVPPKSYPYSLAPGTSVRVSCANVNGGPVKVASTNTVNIVASERVAYKSGDTWTSFSEIMGLPQGRAGNTYVFPWYNNNTPPLDTQLRFGNVTDPSTGPVATVHVYIGGQEMTSGCTVDKQPSNSPYTLPAGASLRVSCAGVNDGPVKIASNVSIVAAERVVINNGSAGISFSELMGLPSSQLATGYVFPYYNNLALDTQLRFGVP